MPWTKTAKDSAEQIVAEHICSDGEYDAIMLAVYTDTCMDECRVFG